MDTEKRKTHKKPRNIARLPLAALYEEGITLEQFAANPSGWGYNPPLDLMFQHPFSDSRQSKIVGLSDRGSPILCREYQLRSMYQHVDSVTKRKLYCMNSRNRRWEVLDKPKIIYPLGTSAPPIKTLGDVFNRAVKYRVSISQAKSIKRYYNSSKKNIDQTRCAAVLEGMIEEQLTRLCGRDVTQITHLAFALNRAVKQRDVKQPVFVIESLNAQTTPSCLLPDIIVRYAAITTYDGQIIGQNKARQWFLCQGYGDYRPRAYSITTISGTKYCADFVKMNSALFGDCGTCGCTDLISLLDGSTSSWGVRSMICTACRERSNQTVISNYSTNVLSALEYGFRLCDSEQQPAQAHAIRPIWLGIELEVHPRPDNTTAGALKKCAKAFQDDDKGAFAIFKRDGSIPDDGFEIVTLPATLAYHRHIWERFFDRTIGASRSLRSWETGKCGMHVHIDIRAFSPLQLGRFMEFYNARCNNAFMSSIAGREIHAGASYCPTDTNIKIRHAKHVFYVRDGRCEKKAVRGFQHYAATGISKSTDGNTLEVRIFRGNVARVGFFKNLEFVQATVLFAKETSNVKLHHKDFLAWFDTPNNRGAFKILWAWLVKKALLKSDHKPLQEGDFERYLEAEI